ncbi:Glycine-rich RNA-binding protein 10 [Apostasia shenzhenica]|uniref:Glycine-rich RNA-binding protein 10 n=1 Tax=Apostasia shenzhenica TaxID=1088818 RepID=A0A2I0AC66_9ASPA|nr:Glycine-rich RNA-binding protein 10 [Apostasia shenzhenica]
MATGGHSPQYYRSRFGDTTLTKVFVGGLAWETPTEELRRYFQQFGEILEAVIITDKNTGRSKGYGFVTFRDPESARRSVADPNPLIDGRRANCNIAALGRPRPSPPRGRAQVVYPPGPQQQVGPPYARLPAQMAPPTPVVYPTPYGYMTYAGDYGYQQGAFNPHLASQYYQQMMYGPTTPSTVGPPPYHYPQMGYLMQPPRASFPPSTLQAQVNRLPYGYHQTAQIEMDGLFFPTSTLPGGFQLQAPPHIRQHTASGNFFFIIILVIVIA